MVSKTISGLLVLALFAVFLLRRQRRRHALALSHGSEPPVTHQPKEPFYGLDVQIRMHSHIPFLYELHQRYGHTYQVQSWIGPLAVCTIAPENLRAVNVSKDFGVEPLRLPGLEYFCGRGFVTTDGDTWKHARKLLKPSFDMSNVRDLSTLRGEVGRLLEQLPKDGSTVDLQPLLYVMFLNSALHFVLGVHPSKQSSGAPVAAAEFVKSFHSALFYSMLRIFLGRMWTLLPQKRYINACATVHEYLDYYISQASAETEVQKTKSLIGELSVQTDDPVFVHNQVIQAMMAAQDTTSELLTNALFLLARHPGYWEQLRTEFVGISEDELSAEKVQTSRLITNISHETLRLHPILPLTGRIALRDTSLPVGGGPLHNHPVSVQKGTMVALSYYALHRDTSVFGDDVETFRPERWNSIKPGQWEFLGFGGGNRACLGQQKATIEAAYVLARLAQSLKKLESRDDQDWKGELKLTCKSANGCKVAAY